MFKWTESCRAVPWLNGSDLDWLNGRAVEPLELVELIGLAPKGSRQMGGGHLGSRK